MDIEEIVEIIKRNKDQYGITLYPPASKFEIDQFENSLKITLPENFKKFYKSCNGFESEEDLFRIIPLNEIISRLDEYSPNQFYIAEYLTYCDMWKVVINPTAGTYKIQDLTNSFAEFVHRFLKGGVFGPDGLCDWKDEIEKAK